MCSFPIWCLGEDTELDITGAWLLSFCLLHSNIKTTLNCLEYAFRVPVLENEDDDSKWLLYSIRFI